MDPFTEDQIEAMVLAVKEQLAALHRPAAAFSKSLDGTRESPHYGQATETFSTLATHNYTHVINCHHLVVESTTLARA